jgi:hypothetical protein
MVVTRSTLIGGGTPLWVLAWLASRGLVVWLLLGRHAWVTGDVGYFATSLAAVPQVGLAATLVEYPLPGVVVVAAPWLLAGWLGAPDAYAETVLAFSLAADAAFALLLGRQRGPGRRAALGVWLLAVPLLGATVYARFDLVPGLLAATGLLLLPSRPRLAAAAAGLATGLKLWPALLLPALAAPTRRRRGVVTVVAAVGVLLAGTTVAVAGWGRLLSPLTWQAERGLQIESVPATAAMVAWAASSGASHRVGYGEHNAFEVTGPGVPQLLLASEVLSLLLVPALVWLWSLAWRRGALLQVDAVVWLGLASVAAFMATSKVLSPQYLLWLLPSAAAGLPIATTTSAALRTWSAVLLVTAGATQLVFPERYADLVQPTPGSGAVVLVLVVRNVLLVWLVWRAATVALRELSAASTRSASHRGRRREDGAASGGAPTTPKRAGRPARRRLRRRAPAGRRSAPRPPRPSRRP